MKTDHFRGDVQSDLNVRASRFVTEYPADTIPKDRDMEDWWDRRAGGWTPDKIAV